MEIRWAISDIHGNGRQFVELLDYVDPDPEQMIICGDLVNRGLDSWGVFEECAQLIEEGCKIVGGNHDIWYMKYRRSQLPHHFFVSPDVGGITTLKSIELAVQRHGVDHVNETINTVLDAIIPYYETEDFIFVHAGIDPRIPTMGRQLHEYLYNGCDAWRNPNMYHTFDQVIVFGHTPTFQIHRNISSDEATVWFSRQRRKMGIDTGAGFGCRLTMVDLQKGIAYAYDFKTREIIKYQFMNPKGFKRRYY